MRRPGSSGRHKGIRLRNAVVGAIAAILLLTGGALWFVTSTTRVDPPRGAATRAAGAADGAGTGAEAGGAGPGAQAAAGGAPEDGEGAAARPVGGGATARATPPDPRAPVPLVPWNEVRTSRLNAMRGPERDPVIFGMQNLQDDLKACSQPHNQPKDGAPVPAAPGAWEEQEEGRTVLLLSLEARRGEVVVVDVAVQVRGGAADGHVACVQRLLQGHAFPALDARPGWRQKVRYPLGG